MQIKDIVAGRKYTTKNGEEKTRWITVGKLLIKDDGHFSLKFEDYINPGAFRNEKGEVWFNVFDQKAEKPENAPKTAQVNLPNTDEGETRKRVMAAAREYSSKWREQAQSKNTAESIFDEDSFGSDECIVDGVNFND